MTLKSIVEALLFASQKPLQPTEILATLSACAKSQPSDLAAVEFAKAALSEIHAVMLDLQADYEDQNRAFRLFEVAGGWQLVSDPAFAPWVRQLYPEPKPARLSAPALETLAIVAYRQPITRSDIEAVRGVAVDGVIQTLLERNLIKTSGRADIPGRPTLYSTTPFFLTYFGLKSLDELPNADELRSVKLPSAVEIEQTDPNQPVLPFQSGLDGSSEPNTSGQPTSQPATPDPA